MKVSPQHPSEEERIVSNISDMRFTMKDLASFMTYEVSVRAVSPAGEGPWSESFRGTTLAEGENCFVMQEKGRMSYAYSFPSVEVQALGQRLQNEGHKKSWFRTIKEYRISKFAFS